jgi:Protein of unknown function (DUF2851)
MQESFIHYIWQFQYFDKKELTTSEGEKIEVFNPGMLNTHSGPDFSNAKIRIDGIDWVGSVEIHPKASGWLEHRHGGDPAYEKVVLHVVWLNDEPIYRADSTLLPTVELFDRVDDALIKDYRKLLNNPASIPCRKSFSQVNDVIKLSMLDKALTQRLEMKAAEITAMLKKNKNDWQETTFQLLARNFGFKVNSETFFRLAQTIPCRILLKHADKLQQVEALLFGQAGLLEIAIGDEYYQLLQREYKILGQKYNLSRRKLSEVQWRFLRLRPPNFPTVRLAQFAALVVKQKSLFSRIFGMADFYELRNLFIISQSEYWQNHYQFNRPSKHKVADLGEASIDNILINSIAPLFVAYGKELGQQLFIDRAVQILQHVSSENNAITRSWEKLGYRAKTAFDSQALIELHNNFCQRRNCLNCAIGASLLKPKS